MATQTKVNAKSYQSTRVCVCVCERERDVFFKKWAEWFSFPFLFSLFFMDTSEALAPGGFALVSRAAAFVHLLAFSFPCQTGD